MLALLVEQLGDRRRTSSLRVAAHRVLQQRHRLRRPGMRLAAQRDRRIRRRHRARCADRRVAERVARGGARSPRRSRRARRLRSWSRCRRRIASTNALRQADRVEDLRAAIGLIGRDAHLGHDLQQALVDRLDEALDALHDALIFSGRSLGHRRQRLEGEIGIDRLGAIAGEAGEMMHLARLAGLDDEADRGAQALADQVMMHGRGREQRRDRDAVRPDHAVGEDDDVVARRCTAASARSQSAPQRVLHAARAVLDVIGDVERLGVERILEMADAADLLEILVGEDRLAHFEALALARCRRGRRGSAAAR